MKELLKIGSVTIYAEPDGKYVRFTSNLDICNDGSGPSHGDKTHQAQTAYYNNGKYLNADKDKYLVTPPQIVSMVAPVVMGCLGRVTNLKTGVASDGVVGDKGPKNKTGECAYCLAKIVNPKITHNSGDTDKHYLYEFWPGKAAPGYKLQPS